MMAGPASRPNEVRDGGQGRSRTSDTRIFSAVLYQLSYLAALGRIRWTAEPSEFLSRQGFLKSTR